VILLVPFLYFFVRDTVQVEGADNVGGCTPHSLEIVPSRFSVMVNWKTADECTGYVRYSLTVQDKNGTIASSDGGFLPSTDHSVVIKDLKPQTIYYVSIISDEIRYGEDGNPIKLRPANL